MKNLLLGFLLILISISCKHRIASDNIKTDKVSTEITAIQAVNKSTDNRAVGNIDTTIDKDSIRIVAEHILNGQGIWGRNEYYLFPIMDSLLTIKPESRLFYFKTFAKIVSQSDGYVSEVIGQYVLGYFNSFPKEFIENSILIDDRLFKSMGFEAGIEVQLSHEEDPESFLLELQDKIRPKVADLSESNKARLDTFLFQIQQGIKLDMK